MSGRRRSDNDHYADDLPDKPATCHRWTKDSQGVSGRMAREQGRLPSKGRHREGLCRTVPHRRNDRGARACPGSRADANDDCAASDVSAAGDHGRSASIDGPDGRKPIRHRRASQNALLRRHRRVGQY